MRILVVHNRYQERGGEDVVFRREVALLQEHGHNVEAVELSNDEIGDAGFAPRLQLFARSIWSRSTFKDARRTIRSFRPDVVHVHNWLALVSPSVFHAAWAEDVPVVHTLHNYRLVCPAATLYRDGRICQDCVGGTIWSGVAHACYRGSRQASLGVATTMQVHRRLQTWQRIDAYVAVSHFVKQMMVKGGLPANRVHVKPNFAMPDVPVRTGPGAYGLYVGRITPEKGLRTLVQAWTRPDGPRDLPLKIVGTGPIEREVMALASRNDAAVEFLGARPHEEIPELIANARFVVAPSEWHEPLSVSAIEALAGGVPVLASAVGGFTELIQDDVTGWHFRAGDTATLANVARRLSLDLRANIRMGEAARREYLARYTPARNYAQLMDIYAIARQGRAGDTLVGSN